jgi:hypothetical protein
MLMLTPTKHTLSCQAGERRSFLVRTGESLVRVVYSDESGIGGSIEKEPVTVVTAIMLNMESQWEPVERDLFVIQNYIPRKLLRYGWEIHGKKLFEGIRRHIEEAEKSLPLLLNIPNIHRVPIFYGAVDRAGFDALPDNSSLVNSRGNRNSAYDMAFHSCVRRVESYIETTLHRGERALWIAEHSGYEKSLKNTLGWAKATEAIRIEDEVLDMVRQNPSCLVDTVYFGDSGDSLALQLADVCCSTITNFLLEQHYGFQPRIAEPYYRMIQGQIVNDGTPPQLKGGS